MWFVLICIATWLLMAILFLLAQPLLGAIALLGAAVLTEELLRAYRAEKTAGRDGLAQPEKPPQ